MPKYRKLYTKTVESLDINDMPDDFTRLFWVLLPLALCREGRGLDNAAWLKSKLFPLREDVTQVKVHAAFRWCVERGMIETYGVNGRGYFQVPTFHQYQGDTRKEAESDYPPPQVQTYSGPTPELVQSESSTDSVFSIQYADTEDSSPGADASAAVAALDVPSTFEDWQKRVEKPPNGSNRQAVLVAMFSALYPGKDPPAFGYIGKIAREVGGAGRLAELLWQTSTRPPTGDILAYCKAVAKGGSRHAKGYSPDDRIILPNGKSPVGATPEEFYSDDG